MDELTRIEATNEALEAPAAEPVADEAELGDAGKVIDPLCVP